MKTIHKAYISPAVSTTIVLTAAWPLCASDPIPVKSGEEGDQSGADSRRSDHHFSLWDEEEEE